MDDFKVTPLRSSASLPLLPVFLMYLPPSFPPSGVMLPVVTRGQRRHRRNTSRSMREFCNLLFHLSIYLYLFLSIFLPLSHTHTLSHTLSRTHTHSLTHTFFLSLSPPSFSLPPSSSHSLSFSTLCSSPKHTHTHTLSLFALPFIHRRQEGILIP
jgi:hypothetical protein